MWVSRRADPGQREAAGAEGPHQWLLQHSEGARKRWPPGTSQADPWLTQGPQRTPLQRVQNDRRHPASGHTGIGCIGTGRLPPAGPAAGVAISVSSEVLIASLGSQPDTPGPLYSRDSVRSWGAVFAVGLVSVLHLLHRPIACLGCRKVQGGVISADGPVPPTGDHPGRPAAAEQPRRVARPPWSATAAGRVRGLWPGPGHPTGWLWPAAGIRRGRRRRRLPRGSRCGFVQSAAQQLPCGFPSSGEDPPPLCGATMTAQGVNALGDSTARIRLRAV